MCRNLGDQQKGISLNVRIYGCEAYLKRRCQARPLEAAAAGLEREHNTRCKSEWETSGLVKPTKTVFT